MNSSHLSALFVSPFVLAIVLNCSVLAVSQANRRERTATEIVRMQEAGLDKSVLLAYLRNVRVPYTATADDILFLHEHKIADDVICEWINRGGALMNAAVAARQQAAQQAPARSPDLVAAYSQPALQQQPLIYQPTPVVATASAYAYTSPSYVYPSYYPSYYYWAPLYSGFHRRWHHRPHYWSHWRYHTPRYHHAWHGHWKHGGHRWHKPFYGGHRHFYSRGHFRGGGFGGHRMGLAAHHSFRGGAHRR